MSSTKLGACLHHPHPVSPTTRDVNVRCGRRSGSHRAFSLIVPALFAAAVVGPSNVYAAPEQAPKLKVVHGWKAHPETQAGMKAVEKQLTAVLAAIKKENEKCACIIGPRPRLDADVAALLKEVSAINRGQ